MPKGIVVFVVEGHLEQKFLTEICNCGVKVLKLPNGKTVTPFSIAKQVNAQILLVKEPAYVVVLVDREKRPQSSIALEGEIRAELKRLQFNHPFSVHVPDMMIENWMLADDNALKKYNLDIAPENRSEGCHGKAKIIEGFRKNKSKYNEIIDGVPLLKSCSPSIMSANNASFNRLFSALGPILKDCHWMKK
ncbi:DUF4276 family protein [Burkholderia multivorans]|uniref:DUF4276 family protein n=1 Tax=Burkholderia multivorans TaxID=87883 RepID=UPI001C21BA3B|nr:DUF4276 family protein [Burkholderia multivorans]MBU9281995.1 DUF4276 family protein [Burkholderia multivorans]